MGNSTTDDIVEEVKKGFEEGGNWPYEVEGHKFEENPFAEKWPDDKLFAGHGEELRRLQENIQRGANTFILGPFGTGKTILTRTIRNILEEVDGYKPIFVRVEKGRFSKEMAKRLLDDLEVEYNSTSSQSTLYQKILDEMERLYTEEGTRTVIFFDEVINGSEGTLRRILDLQRDIDAWEPVLIFNGTTHMMQKVRSDIAPLYDRIMDEIHLEALDSDGAKELVNKRLRFYCKNSEWNNGEGCEHDEGSLKPLTEESIEMVHQDITPFPRHLRNSFNEIMENAAKKNVETVNPELVEETMEKSFRKKLQELGEKELKILDYLSEEGKGNVNSISKKTDIPSYQVQEILTRTLEKQGFVRATASTHGISYKITDTTRRELSNLREA